MMREFIEIIVFSHCQEGGSGEAIVKLEPSKGTPEPVVEFVRGFDRRNAWVSKDGKVTRVNGISSPDFELLKKIVSKEMASVWFEVAKTTKGQESCALLAKSLYEAGINWEAIREEERERRKVRREIDGIVNGVKRLRELLTKFEKVAPVSLREGGKNWVTSPNERVGIMQFLDGMLAQESLEVPSHPLDSVNVVLSSRKAGGKSDLVRALLMSLKSNNFPYMSEEGAPIWAVLARSLSIVKDEYFNSNDIFRYEEDVSYSMQEIKLNRRSKLKDPPIA